MKSKAIDLTKILKGITSGWVAISSDYKKLVVKGRNLSDVSRQVKDLPRGSVVLMPMRPSFRNVVTTNFTLR